MYTSRVKTRKIKRIFQKLFNTLKFKTFNFPLAQKILLLSIILGIISLFLPWITIKQPENILIFSGFNNITFFTSFIILIIFILQLYLIFSFQGKEKIKIFTGIHSKNYILLILNIGIILLGINSIFIIRGLNIFYSNIEFSKGIILLIISGFLGIITSLYTNNKNKEKIIVSESEKKNNIHNENNMKLPI